MNAPRHTGPPFPAVKLVLCSLLAACLPPCPSRAGDAVPTDHMTAAEVGAALRAYPPAPANTEPRSLIAQSLDKLVYLTVKADLTDAELAELAPVRDLYLQQVERGLTELEKCRVTQGVRVFKFYSSSVVIKSKDGTVAIDFQQGPHLTYCGRPEQPDPVAARTGFHWSPQQLDRLAKVVDVALITHPHADHADSDLCRRLLAQGKPVVLPQQLKELWASLGGKPTVPDYGHAQRFGPVEILTADGCQYMQNDRATIGAGGTAIGYPTDDPQRTPDAETVVYLARIGGIVFLQAAENNVPMDAWLRQAISDGWRPDVRMAIGARQGARSIAEVLKALHEQTLMLPVHEYEMGHPNGGNRTAPYFTGAYRRALDRGLLLPLFWGEDSPLDPASLPGHAASGKPAHPANDPD